MAELRDHERLVLDALDAACWAAGGGYFVPLRAVVASCPTLARRIVRKDLEHLARKGLVHQPVRDPGDWWAPVSSAPRARGVVTVLVQHAEQVPHRPGPRRSEAVVVDQDPARDPRRRQRRAPRPEAAPNPPPLDAA